MPTVSRLAPEITIVPVEQVPADERPRMALRMFGQLMEHARQRLEEWLGRPLSLQEVFDSMLYTLMGHFEELAPEWTPYLYARIAQMGGAAG